MSKHSLNVSVNRGATASGLRLGDHLHSLTEDGLNPIRRFEARTRSLIVAQGVVCSTPPLPLECGLFLLGIISAAESYVRDIFTQIVVSCRLSRRRLSDLPLSFGAIDYYGEFSRARGLLQGKSLADASELRKLVTKISGLKISEGDQIWTAIEEFSGICHVRHAIIHAFGDLGLNNLSAMNFHEPTEPHKVTVNNALFQSASVVCTNLARILNQSLFENVISDWINSGELVGTWETDKGKWNRIWSEFASTDGCVPESSYRAWLKIKTAAVARSAAINGVPS